MARTILVADDSPTIQKKASGILTGEGLEVVTVSNGVAAVKKLPTVKPMVVLADVSMPGKDGYEVCEHIKSTADIRNTPVILIFSDTDPYEGARGARVQADATIKKPFDHDELIATVNKFVAQVEAMAAKPVAPPAQPPAAYEVEPVDEDPEAAAKPEAPDLSALPEGVAFGMPGMEEPAADPGGFAAIPSSPVLESEVAAEPVLDSFLPSPETEAPSPEVQDMLAPEPPAVEEPPAPAEPVYVEEAPAPASEPEPEPQPESERTMMFHNPADIAEPVLSDDPGLADTGPVQAATETAAPPYPPAVEEPPAVSEVAPPEPEPVAEPLHEPEQEFEPPPPSPTTLENYTLNDAAAGQVRFGSAETEVAPPAEAEPTPEPEPEPVPEPEPAAAPAAKAIDPEEIYSIVHRVVVKMSPPALSSEMIEDMARKFADEIISDLNSQS